MNFVIDTNIILSALIKDSVTRKIIIKSGLNFYYPEISFHEIQKHKLLVLKKSGMSEKQFNNIFDILLDNVILVSEEQFAECLDEANDLMGKIDIDDVVFLACAIALETDIWTDDGDFQKQKKVKVLKTKDFVKRFLRV